MSEFKSGSNLEKVLKAGHFAFTGECGPPKGANVEHLKEKERETLILRFGLRDGIPRTLEEIGADFGLTRERVRQIEGEAIKKLRRIMNAKEQRDKPK